MNAPTPATDTRIADFAAAVRAELVDLDIDEVDDLVDGLEADLAEQASESDEFELPDPVTYAAELRSAAGLPAKATDAAPRRPSLGARLAALDARLERAVQSSKALTWVTELLVSLRPVWWVARGWALYALVSVPLWPDAAVVGVPYPNPWGAVLLGALVLLSIQWGRGRWAPVAWLRGVRTVVSIATAVALPFLIGTAVGQVQTLIQTRYLVESVDSITPGLAVDGTRVRNIFAYDAEGNPIEGVQLFDQDGRPLNTVGREDDHRLQWDEYFLGGGGPAPVPVTVPGRTPVWNVYPLREMAPDVVYDQYGSVDTDDAEAPAFPFPQVPAAPGSSEPTPTPTPDPAPTGTQP